MNVGTVLLLLLLLACPLMMVLMMRGGHRGHTGRAGCGHEGGHDRSRTKPAEPMLDGQRRRRNELDRLIEDAEATSGETVSAGARPARRS